VDKKKLDRGEASKGITAERVVTLTAAGFVWDPPQGAPSAAKAAKAAKAIQAAKVAEAAKASKAAKAAKAASNEQWEAQLAQLVAYQAEYGDCMVPQGWAEDRKLSSWVMKQRQNKRKLDRGEPGEGMTAKRAAKLTALGFAWGRTKGNTEAAVLEAAWKAQLAVLAAYKAEHGDCYVPSCWAEDQKLSSWVSKQRKNKRKLDRGEPVYGITAKRVAKLTALGFAWEGKARSCNEAKWEAQLARLVAYKVEHGNFNVPLRWTEDLKLGSWVMHQRGGKRKLDRGDPCEGMTVERAARLTALGFAWEPPSKNNGWEGKNN
jgi:hypothetical protein